MNGPRPQASWPCAASAGSGGAAAAAARRAAATQSARVPLSPPLPPGLLVLAACVFSEVLLLGARLLALLLGLLAALAGWGRVEPHKLDRCHNVIHHYLGASSKVAVTVLVLYVLEGNRENCSVSAPRRPSVRADPQGMQPG